MTTIELEPKKTMLTLEPKPGFYPNMEADVYHTVNAASKSLLGEMAAPKTPANLLYVLENGPLPRECFVHGDAVHAIALEPLRFAEDYIISERCSAVKKNGEACTNWGINMWGGEWRCGVHEITTTEPDKRKPSISREKYTDFKAMRASMYAHPVAREIMEAAKYIEASSMFRDNDTGEWVKCRYDIISYPKRRRVIADLKSTIDASPSGFGRQVRKFKYKIQAGLYPIGLKRTLGDEPTDFVFIAVENKAPFLTATYKVSLEDRAQGYDQFKRLLEQYRECKATGIWPGYSQELETLQIPADFDEEGDVELSIGGQTVKL